MRAFVCAVKPGSLPTTTVFEAENFDQFVGARLEAVGHLVDRLGAEASVVTPLSLPKGFQGDLDCACDLSLACIGVGAYDLARRWIEAGEAGVRVGPFPTDPVVGM